MQSFEKILYKVYLFYEVVALFVIEMWQEIVSYSKQMQIPLDFTSVRIVLLIFFALILFILLWYINTSIPQKTLPKDIFFSDKKKTLLMYLADFSISYSDGNVIRRILKYSKVDNESFFLRYKKFETSVEKFLENLEPPYGEIGVTISKIRNKLNFTSKNTGIDIYKTQQLHENTVLNVSVPLSDQNNIRFQSVIIENNEDCLTISLPTVNNQTKTIKSGKEIKLQMVRNSKNYNFDSVTLGLNSQKNGIVIEHARN